MPEIAIVTVSVPVSRTVDRDRMSRFESSQVGCVAGETVVDIRDNAAFVLSRAFLPQPEIEPVPGPVYPCWIVTVGHFYRLKYVIINNFPVLFLPRRAVESDQAIKRTAGQDQTAPAGVVILVVVERALVRSDTGVTVVPRVRGSKEDIVLHRYVFIVQAAREIPPDFR